MRTNTQSLNLRLKLLFIFFPLLHFGQLKTEWVSPLEIPIQLSGTFGEFRSNHFHAGLDIRTKGRQGLKVNSIQNGWINRIKVSTSGYGKAIYIQHYDGTTSVYAHLKKFAPKIETYLKEKQYEKESYTIQLFPKSEELQVTTGELIGYSGNSGGSYGPHLHFEVRNSSNQNPINPMSYPFKIKDSQRPQIQNFYLYDGIHPDSNKKEYPLVKKNDSVYSTAGIHIGGKVNVGLRLFDRQDLSYNKNGIYKAIIRLNGIPQFEMKMDRISFNDSKYINLLIDYKEWTQKKRRIQRFISHTEQKTSFLSKDIVNGEMKISPGKSYQILIEVSDYDGNTSYLEAYITGADAITETKKQKDLLDPSKDYLFDFENRAVYFPKNSFYDSIPVEVKIEGEKLFVGKNHYPLKKPFEVKFKIAEQDSLIRSQSFIASLSSKNEPYFFSNKIQDDQWVGKSKTLGTFVISRDSVAPEIKPLNFKKGQWLNSFSYLKVKLSDDYSGIKSYRGEINGKWILFEYEPKNESLIYDFKDLNFEKELHHLTIEAEDNAGNISKLDMEFYRKAAKKKQAPTLTESNQKSFSTSIKRSTSFFEFRIEKENRKEGHSSFLLERSERKTWEPD